MYVKTWQATERNELGRVTRAVEHYTYSNYTLTTEEQNTYNPDRRVLTQSRVTKNPSGIVCGSSFIEHTYHANRRVRSIRYEQDIDGNGNPDQIILENYSESGDLISTLYDSNGDGQWD